MALQEPVQAAIDALIASGEETGLQVASVAHVLVERGELDYEQRVVGVWPDFGAHGKDRVTVRDVLVHAAGVPGLWPDITPADLGDWECVCAFLAGQRPWWEPGVQAFAVARARESSCVVGRLGGSSCRLPSAITVRAAITAMNRLISAVTAAAQTAALGGLLAAIHKTASVAAAA